MSTDFLARWSRRKRGVDSSTPETSTQPQPQTAEGVAPVEDEEPDAPAKEMLGDELVTTPGRESVVGASAPVVAVEEAEPLPDPEELTAASDITGFLRAGVPAALRNRALRRMWSLDPAIRDSIGDARDYAWDWNTPGGMPVSGPISSSIDVDKMVRGIFGTQEAPAPETPQETEAAQPVVPAPAPIPGERPGPADADAAAEPAAAPAAREPAPAEKAEPTADAVAAGQDADEGKPTPRERPWRHGGALPV